ncbi:MAG: tRNA (N(6)-L-threonylcarbamoyladenosine(37)-C(2))-methylthiotransferase MtaB [Rickettsiales bacterium]|nr:tRNA (N(6)-L-threonylcarbamoyladenosine(37)-C(2))-methylthiotransferase MtaB [Rickettsiales bacterium]
MSENQVITFGCRLNIFESEIIKNNLEASNKKNSLIFNSCAVTSEAERKLGQAIRKYHKKFPEKEIIVTGCAAQLHPEKYINMPEVSKVIGNKEKIDIRSYQDNKNIIVSDIMQLEDAASHLAADFNNKARAYLEIQNGCNHRCTFCIIPYARGNNRSVPIKNIISSCQAILAKNINEIVLTGVDITDYGANLKEKINLGKLLKEIFKELPELKRLRLSSLDVAEIDDDLKELIVTEKRLMPHFHLSLQSGDNMILKRMKRRHQIEDIIKFCNFVRQYRQDAAIGADLITGFPTETEEMHQNTKELIKQLEISHLHVFPYSEREGTPAAKIPADKQIDKKIRKERAKELIAIGKDNLENYSKKFIGKKISAIAENPGVFKTDHYLNVKISGSNLPQGQIRKILVTDYKNNQLIGEIDA